MYISGENGVWSTFKDGGLLSRQCGKIEAMRIPVSLADFPVGRKSACLEGKVDGRLRAI
jgi:hypothetical protein